jgi:alkylation response protein AidB-like acyl-CoA dehydrogenase
MTHAGRGARLRSSPDAALAGGPVRSPGTAAGGAVAKEAEAMTTTLTETPPTAPVLDAVRELAPVIAGRAVEIETARRVPADLLGDLVATGCFRMLLPATYGGGEVDLLTAIAVIEELSRADASVGWVVSLGANAWRDVCAVPRAAFDEIYASGPDVMMGGAINPSGVAEPADGGFRITGRWGFVSGCEHAEWLFCNCIEQGGGADGDGGGTGDGGGMPVLRMAVLRADEVAIEDTWRVSGLCGTGSHHIVADRVVVPADRTYLVLEDEPAVDIPYTRIPLPAPYSVQMAAVGLGIARGALDDVVALAAEKVPLFAHGPLAADPGFQHTIGSADARLRAARAGVLAETRELWATAEAGGEFSDELRARVRGASVWAAQAAAEVVDAAYTAGGGSSLYLASPLQRRLRDVHVLTQHFLVRPGAFTTTGAVLAGQDIDTPFL